MPETESSALALWRALDDEAGPAVLWARGVPGRRVTVLMGAFDPPTTAHLRIARAAARVKGAAPALCLTKVVLDRPADRLLADDDRVRLLDRLTGAEELGFALANRGTYLDVARTLSADGFDPTFVVGSDKLTQLADPSFYASIDGPDATFAEVRFLVVPRRGWAVDRDDVEVLDPADVFEDPSESKISATEVRRRVTAGRGVQALVPPVVAESLEGYTAAEPR